MRFLFASYAERTHFFPMVPIAWALRAAGHEVRVATQRPLVPAVLESGLPTVAVAGDHDWQRRVVAASSAKGDWEGWVQRVTDVARTGHRMGWDDLHAYFEEQVEHAWKHFNHGLVDGLAGYAREWRPDMILWEPFTFAAAVAARALGIPHARVTWGADVWVRARRRFTELLAERSPELRSDPLRDWLGAEAARFGADFDEELFTGQWTIDQSPPSMRLESGVRTIPARYVPYNGPAEIPDWLREPPRRPRVCVTGGLTARGLYGADLLGPALLDRLAALDVEVVATVAAGDGERPAVPDNVRLVDFVPMDPLLETCSAVVHMGGFGVMSTAMRHGVPQLTLPKLGDSTVRADLLRATGAGLVVSHDEATPDTVRDAVARLLAEPGFGEAAERLRRETLSEPAPGAVAAALEGSAAGRSGLRAPAIESEGVPL
ncbi:activator-dependent family glycosyltransferase [Actinomadura darangshiensis]|uniref:Activator-dependent family glycosyltransferase n=2 Tax=Actinomadura darangshiensis TaxID=705336 RepID=A0A4R5BMH9_9ACTN|nr:activator-dependent family glycosyltransferase [Actinomadura darangshiensis]TDD86526.1 activator-dependent family glycosyltransferase [Actinomadura darangshiensis]